MSSSWGGGGGGGREGRRKPRGGIINFPMSLSLPTYAFYVGIPTRVEYGEIVVGSITRYSSPPMPST